MVRFHVHLILSLVGLSSLALAWPRVYISSAFQLGQLFNPANFPITARSAGIHVHPVGFSGFDENQQRALFNAFANKEVMWESQITNGWRGLAQRIGQAPGWGIRVVYVTSNIPTKLYIDHKDRPIVIQGERYNNSADVISQLTRQVNSRGARFGSLFTVWNGAAQDPDTDTWMASDRYWWEAVGRSQGVVHDWPGGVISYKNGGAPHEYAQRWNFYGRVWRMCKRYGKHVMHYFNVYDAQSYQDTMTMVREIENGGYVPDVWIFGRFRQGNINIIPERAGGRFARTVSGITGWMVSRIHGAAENVVDMTVLLENGLELAKGFSADQVFTNLLEDRSDSFKIAVTNNDEELDYIPVVRVKPIEGVKFFIENEDISAAIMSEDGYVLKGEHRLWPGQSKNITVVASDIQARRIEATVLCHPQAEMDKHLQDKLVLTF